MAQRGGLYGGIHFSSGSIAPAVENTSNKKAAPKVQETTQIPTTPTAAAISPAAPAPVQEIPAGNAAKSNAGWSAALAFAPVRRAQKAKTINQARLPPGATVVASLEAAASTLATVSQPTVTIPVVQEKESTREGWNKKIAAPSMVIEDDVNGFKAKRAGEKRKGKKNKNANLIVWDPMDPYDPYHPNDYHEYKKWKRRDKDEHRMAQRRKEDDRKRRRASDDSDYTSDGHSGDEHVRKSARYYSPQRDERSEPDDKMYIENDEGFGREGFESTFQGAGPQSDIIEPASPETVPPPPSSGEEAYLRRLAMSTRHLPDREPVHNPEHFVVSAAHFPPTTPAESLSVSPSSVQPLLQRHTDTTSVSTMGTLLTNFTSGPQEIDSERGDFDPPAAMSSSPPPVPPPSLSQATINERMKNAQAIAAKLSAIALAKAQDIPAVTESTAPVPAAEDSKPTEVSKKSGTTSFAERMMAKYGHKPGQGLGRDGTGIVEPITLEQMAAPKTKGKKGGGASSSSEQTEGPKSRVGGMGIGGVRMGKLVNTNLEEKHRAELEKYGENSRIVVLTNMVGLEDLDDDLQTDVGDECSKHGVVERVLIHLVEPPPMDEADAVRIFVQFSGPAGAWKAIRELDGRLFAGRSVRARYFDEGKFAKRLINDPL